MAQVTETIATTTIVLTPSQLDALSQIEECLRSMYKRERNIVFALEKAKAVISKGGKYELKRAPWGGRWSNYYHYIGLNSKNTYQFVAGFSPEKNLD